MDFFSPTEQFLPVYPATQSQRISFTSYVQFPPFWHGSLAQSSMSEFKKERDAERQIQNWDHNQQPF